MPISAVQQSDPVICIYTFLFLHPFLHFSPHVAVSSLRTGPNCGSLLYPQRLSHCLTFFPIDIARNASFFRTFLFFLFFFFFFLAALRHMEFPDQGQIRATVVTYAAAATVPDL